MNFIHYELDIFVFFLYEIDDIKHSYFSDYKIKNTNIVIEIKSKYMWKKNFKINIAKKEYAEKLYDCNLIIDNDFNKINNKINKVI